MSQMIPTALAQEIAARRMKGSISSLKFPVHLEPNMATEASVPSKVMKLMTVIQDKTASPAMIANLAP